MMRMNLGKYLVAIFPAMLLAGLSCMATSGEASDTSRYVVIQVSTDDPVAQNTALDKAGYLQQSLAPGQAGIEIVAYGPGLSLLAAGNETSGRIPALARQGIRFSACAKTIERLADDAGMEAGLVEGVEIVPDGAARIAELQARGYAYLRP